MRREPEALPGDQTCNPNSVEILRIEREEKLSILRKRIDEHSEKQDKYNQADAERNESYRQKKAAQVEYAKAHDAYIEALSQEIGI